MSTLAGILSILTTLTIQAVIIGAIVYGIYRLARKLNHDKIDYEYRCKKYYDATKDLEDLERDMKNHQEDKP